MTDEQRRGLVISAALAMLAAIVLAMIMDATLWMSVTIGLAAALMVICGGFVATAHYDDTEE